eukprot:4385757-Pyramimonas_sp.AAC.1
MAAAARSRCRPCRCAATATFGWRARARQRSLNITLRRAIRDPRALPSFALGGAASGAPQARPARS